MQERFNTTGDSPGNCPESLRRSRVLSAMRTSRRLSIDGWVRLAPWRWRMFASEALPIPKRSRSSAKQGAISMPILGEPSIATFRSCS